MGGEAVAHGALVGARRPLSLSLSLSSLARPRCAACPVLPSHRSTLVHAAQLEEERAATAAFRAARRSLQRTVWEDSLSARRSVSGGGGGPAVASPRLLGALTVSCASPTPAARGLRALLERRRAAVLLRQDELHSVLGSAALNVADPEQVKRGQDEE